MKIVLTPKHYALVSLGLIILLLDFMFLFSFSAPIGPKGWYFSPIVVIGLLAVGLPFVQDVLTEAKRQKELELKFLEFVRNLVETVRSGVSIPKAIIQVRSSGAEFGALTPYITKLANQIEWGYPLHQAFTIFANDTKNPVIKRSVAIVIQAEKSGGDMAAVLEAVSASVLEIKKLKDERKSNAYSQMIQGYIIFFVFVAIMIVMEVYLIPQLTKIGGEVSTGLAGSIGASAASGGKAADLGPVFLETIVVQGIFAGLMIGKFSEGDFRSGLKHSIIMVVGGYLILTTVSGIIGTGSAPVVAAGSASALLLCIREKWVRKVRA